MMCALLRDELTRYFTVARGRAAFGCALTCGWMLQIDAIGGVYMRIK
jgi:hypothetical protein